MTLEPYRREFAASFGNHEPWWEAYHVSASYFTRLSVALSHGQQVNRVLVLEPTTTAWMHQGDESSLKGLGDSFTGLLMDLEKAQIESDLGCEDVIARHGSATSTGLRIGQRTYPIVVLPPRTENLNLSTVVLLEKFVANGGRVLACGAPPGRLDGEPSDRAPALARLPGWTSLESRYLPGSLIEPESDFQITRTPGDSGILFHHRRQFEDGQMLFLVNTSDTHPSSGTVQAKAGGIEAWKFRSHHRTALGMRRHAQAAIRHKPDRRGCVRHFEKHPGAAPWQPAPGKRLALDVPARTTVRAAARKSVFNRRVRSVRTVRSEACPSALNSQTSHQPEGPTRYHFL